MEKFVPSFVQKEKGEDTYIHDKGKLEESPFPSEIRLNESFPKKCGVNASLESRK